MLFSPSTFVDQPPLQWEELYDAKLPDNYDDPGDLLAIADAEMHMGDFKLKSTDDFIVPEHMRMSGQKVQNKIIQIKLEVRRHDEVLIPGTKLATLHQVQSVQTPALIYEHFLYYSWFKILAGVVCMIHDYRTTSSRCSYQFWKCHHTHTCC